MDFTMFGPGIVLGLACLGSAVGCAIAAMASHGVMTHTEEGHGKFIGLSAVPSSQAIYGFVLMIMMRNSLNAKHVSPMSAVGIAFFVGLAIMISAIYQGKVVATAIQSSAKQPNIFGKTLPAVGIVESFSLFAFVFALMII